MSRATGRNLASRPLITSIVCYSFFFFQAEDGIRDYKVTGVQTCALPISLEAAFGRGPGVVVIAGTGSIAYGRNAAGQTARAGGWGFAISDEGSGYWIGRAAVASAMRSLDEEGKSPLLDTILKTWKLESLDELVVTANATPPPNFAALLPAGLAAANAGDPAASDV